MTWLSKLLGFVPKEEREGIVFTHKNPAWEVSGFKDFSSFLRCLAKLFPSDAIIYLEGVSIAPEVQEFLNSKMAINQSKVMMGTIWPRPKIFHMQMAQDHLESLASLAERQAVPEICDHIHVYKNGAVLLEGYDIFDKCIYITHEISEAQIKLFCDALSCTYKEFIPEGV